MRISVTDLESYRYWRDSEDMELDELLKRLRREEPPTMAMQAGSALHAWLETAKAGEAVDAFEQDGFRFLIDCECEIPDTPIRELKGEMELQTSVGPVTLVGVVDGIATEISDHKLTSRFSIERYADSYQWRCYLVMFNGHRFTYNVFVGKEYPDGLWGIYEFHRFPIYSYPGMREDVIREVDEFARFLVQHMPEKAA